MLCFVSLTKECGRDRRAELSHFNSGKELRQFQIVSTVDKTQGGKCANKCSAGLFSSVVVSVCHNTHICQMLSGPAVVRQKDREGGSVGEGGRGWGGG